MNKLNKLIGSLLLSAFMLIGVGVSGNTKDVVRGNAETQVEMSSFSSISGNVGGDSNVTYKAEQGNARTAPVVNSNQIRVYQNGGLFTVSTANDNLLRKVTLGSAMNTTVTYITDLNKTASASNDISKNGKLDVNFNDGETSITFTCKGTSNTTRLYVNYLSVIYYPKITKTITSLVSNTENVKNEYYEEESFNPDGLVVIANYDDNTSKTISYNENTKNNFSFSPSLDTALTTEINKINVTYKDDYGTETFDINITVKENPIIDITLTGDMTTKKYGLNSSWKNDGLVVTATYTSGKTKNITSDVVFTYSPETPNDLSLTSVIASAKYNEFNATLTITGISVVNSKTYDLQFNNNSTGEGANSSINNNQLKEKYSNDYSIIDITNVSSVYGDSDNILKFGASGSTGSITFSVIGNRVIKSVTFNLKTYSNDSTKVLINNELKTLTKTFADYSVDFFENIKEVTLKANTSSKCRFFLYSASFEVVDGEEVLPTSFSITNKQNTLGLNSSIDLTTIIEPSNTTLTVCWVVSLENIVTLLPSGDKNENCKVTSGETLGDVTITATIGSLSDSFTLKVENTTIAVTKVNINKTTLEIYEQQSFQFEATVEPDNATNKEIFWVDDNNNNNNEFATLSNEGLFKALKATTTPIVIHAISSDNETIEATCEVTILKTDYYERIISEEDLKVGDEIIIGGVESNKNIFVSSDKGNNRAQTIVSDGCVDDDGLIVYSSIMDENVAKFLVTDGTVSGSFSLMEVDNNNNKFNGFLSIIASDSKNYLKTTTTKTEDNNLYISVVENDSSFTNYIKNTETEETDTRYIRYNSASDIFSSYKNKAQADIAIYKLHDDLNKPSSKFYKEADKWAMDFYEITNCDTKGSNDLDNTKWNSLKTSYNTLSEPARLFIKYKLYVPVSSGEEIIHTDAVETAVEIYEYVVTKYGYEDFMSRNPIKSTNNVSILNTEKSNETIALIAIISVVSLSAIGGYMFIRKRKEQ